LENRGDQDDKVSGGMWKAVEASGGQCKANQGGKSRKKKKQKKGKIVEVRKVVKKWEI